ncbi:Plasma membrane sulfite pump involved in sulfite metabolism [Exophiala oligosperma]
MSLHDDGKEAHMKLQAMTAVWLLPVVSTIVASATGGITAEALTNAGRHQHAFWTMIISCILFGTGLPIAMVILVIYFHRLTTHRLPPQATRVSVFLPVEPLGQGSYSLMQLDHVAAELFPNLDNIALDKHGNVGSELATFGTAVAMIMW